MRLLLFSLSESKYFILHLLSFILWHLFIYLPISAFSLYFQSICLCICVYVALSAFINVSGGPYGYHYR